VVAVAVVVGGVVAVAVVVAVRLAVAVRQQNSMKTVEHRIIELRRKKQ
jgi:hypothetical protein